MRGSAVRSATMRGALKAACAAAVLLGGILPPASSGATELPLHPDLKIAVKGPPDDPPIIAGHEVVYEVTITDEGAVVAGLLGQEITVFNTVKNGVFVGEVCRDQNECWIDVPAPDVPEASVSFQLKARLAPFDGAITFPTPPDSAQPTFAASITSEIRDDDLANTDSSDDKATAETEVDLNSTTSCTYQGKPVTNAKCRTGYFRPGEHVFGAHTLSVPHDDKTPGVLGELAEVGPDSDFCGKHNCRYGIAVLANFFKVGEFEVTDKSNPLRTIINTPKGDPCRGLGLGTKPCSVLRYEDRPADDWDTPVPEEKVIVIPFCTVDNQVSGHPKLCIDHREKTPSGGLRFEVLLLSNDPGMY